MCIVSCLVRAKDSAYGWVRGRKKLAPEKKKKGREEQGKKINIVSQSMCCLLGRRSMNAGKEQYTHTNCLSHN